MISNSDTICAISTAISNSGIGIIRVSGDDAIEKVDKIFSGKQSLLEAESHTVHYGHIVFDNKVLDEVMVLVFKGPKSYTTEDTVEIDCHGGVIVLQQVLNAVIAQGIRPAEPGEFTKRAFLNGRIDLSQAESVIDIIDSNSKFALQNSMNQLQGSVSTMIKNLRAKIIYEIAYIESALDDPEHISLDGYQESLLPKIQDMKETIKYHLDTAGNGMMLKEGICTAIIGKPNAGKSSLLNTLARKERAIVTDIAGTTRDTLEEQIMLNGICLNIIDTAGIRDTEDSVEKIGVEKSRQLLQEAELVICVVDGSEGLMAEDEAILAAASGKPCVIIVNKSDLGLSMDLEALRARFGRDKVMTLSAKTLSGMEEFSAWLKNYVYGSEGALSDGAYVQNARQERLLREARQSLEEAGEAAMGMLPYDCIEIDVRNAIDLLGEITGDTVQDEIINEIFSRFCIGK